MAYARSDKPELARLEMSAAERDLRSKAAQLLQGAGLLRGTLIERDKTCGNPACRCAEGERHHVLYLHRRADGKLRHLYVPRYLEDVVRRWIAQDHELTDVLGKLWDLEWEKIRSMKTRRRKA